MSHLNETHQGYFAHLCRAWKTAFVLLVHGVLPNVWKTKASDSLCKERLVEKKLVKKTKKKNKKK